jgi:hypothetical protein
MPSVVFANDRCRFVSFDRTGCPSLLIAPDPLLATI